MKALWRSLYWHGQVLIVLVLVVEELHPARASSTARESAVRTRLFVKRVAMDIPTLEHHSRAIGMHPHGTATPTALPGSIVQGNFSGLL